METVEEREGAESAVGVAGVGFDEREGGEAIIVGLGKE